MRLALRVRAAVLGDNGICIRNVCSCGIRKKAREPACNRLACHVPVLVVMYNNRAYYNDWEHEIRMARRGGTLVDAPISAWTSWEPEVDFAGLARSMGWHAEDRIEHGDDVDAALRRAISVESGRPALVDTVTQFR